jgi:hypothetical protein
MEEQIAPSIPAPENFAAPSTATPNFPPTITPEMVSLMKARAREEAIRITMEQRQQVPVPATFQPPTPQQIIYLRRNLTIAELLLTVLLACGIVTGVQLGWKAVSNFIPKVQIQIK